MLGDALLAGTPIAVILVLMIAVRWPAARAGVVGLAATAAIAVIAFGFGRGVPAALPATGAFGGAFAESLFTAATILWIIVPALAIHHLQVATGSTDVLRLGLGRLTGDPRLLALLIAWFFVLFIEGAAGFGASVALAAPFLVSAGFRRVDAVAIALIGHAVGVSFGAVGTPILPQMAATGLSGLELSRATGVYHALVGWVLLAIVLTLVARARPAGSDQSAPIWLWGLLAAVLFLVPFFLLAHFVGPELPTLGGALFGGLAFVAALLLARRRNPAATRAVAAVGPRPGPVVAAPGLPAADLRNLPPASEPASEPAPAPAGAGALGRAAAPYLVLVAAVLVTRLVPAVREALSAVVVEWSFAGQFSGAVQPLYHPGTMLLIGFLAGAVIQRAGFRQVRRAVGRTVGQLGGVAVALVAMLAISRLMVHAGMTDSLAVAAAAAAGGGWPLFAPLVGALGTFVTGSATSSNILFTEFQQATADTLELPVAPVVGAQGFGAAVGNIVCPHNIVAAGATVALTGREGEVLRRTLWVALLYAGLGGLLALYFAGA